MKGMLTVHNRLNGKNIRTGSIYTDDLQESWHFSHDENDDHIEIKVDSILSDGTRKPKHYDLPLCVNVEDIDARYLEVKESMPDDIKNYKEGLKIFLEAFPEITDKPKLAENSDPKWEIQIARYFGHSETTLALLKSPDNEHFLVRSAAYPYGRPAYDRSVMNYRYMHPTKGREHWNDFVNNIAENSNNDLASMAHHLNALSFIPCTSDDPMDEFEEVAETQRFMSREQIADEHEPIEMSKTKMVAQFFKAALGRKQPLSKEHFMKMDVNRSDWYAFERLPSEFKEKYISREEAKELTEQICEDFNIPKIRTLRFCHPRKPKFPWQKATAPSRVEGLYYPETNDIALRFYEERGGVSKHTLLHELTHHINHHFVNNGEPPPAAHGMRFKKIHMHLMHHYDDVPLERLQQFILQRAFGRSFPITEDDILRRDFNESRTFDILPAKPKEQQKVAIPFKDFKIDLGSAGGNLRDIEEIALALG